MQSEEKLALIVGASMVVIGTAGLVLIDYFANKYAKQAAEADREVYMQQGWEMIQRSRMFTTSTPEQRIALFDKYWKTTGGVRNPH